MNIQDLIAGSIGSQASEGISKNLGIDQDKTQWVIAAAVPLMVSALNYNANKGEEKAAQINGALEKHSGGIFDQLTGLFDQGPTEDENRIVSHIFGKNTNQVTESLAEKSGLSANKISGILAFLAPIVMGFLGKQKQGKSNTGIGDILGGLLSGGKGESPLGGGLESIIGSVLSGGNSSQSNSTTDSIGDLVGDFFNKDKNNNKGSILDTLAGMFGK